MIVKRLMSKEMTER